MIGVPLRVTATLEAGVAHAAPWGIALDGILASVIHHQAKADLLDAGLAHPPLSGQGIVEDLDLPLEQCHLGDDWHWAATCAYPASVGDTPDVRYWLSASDSRHLELDAALLPTSLPADKGRYRHHYMPLLVTVTPTVTWDAVGDPDRIRRLLSQVWAIGKKRAAGQGRVLTWDVTTTDRNPWQAGHLHPNGALGRPTPHGCLRSAGYPNQGITAPTGIRPPYHHPSRRENLILPTSAY